MFSSWIFKRGYTPRLLERTLGDLENIRENDVPLIYKWLYRVNSWYHRPPNGESKKDAGQRMKSFLEDIIKERKKDNGIAVFSHGQAITSLLCSIFGDRALREYNLKFENTGIAN